TNSPRSASWSTPAAGKRLWNSSVACGRVNTSSCDRGRRSQPERRVGQADVELQVDVAVALQLLAPGRAAGRRPVVRLEPHRPLRLLVEEHHAPMTIELAVVHLVDGLHP